MNGCNWSGISTSAHSDIARLSSCVGPGSPRRLARTWHHPDRDECDKSAGILLGERVVGPTPRIPPLYGSMVSSGRGGSSFSRWPSGGPR